MNAKITVIFKKVNDQYDISALLQTVAEKIEAGETNSIVEYDGSANVEGEAEFHLDVE